MPGFIDTLLIVGGILLNISLVFFVPLWGPRVVFGKPPANAAAPTALPAFSTADFFVMIGFLSMTNAILSFLRQEVGDLWLICIMLAANTLVVLLWIGGLHHMRQRGIHGPRQRFLFQVVLHPLAVLGPTGVVLSGMMLASAFEDLFDIHWKLISVATLGISLLIMWLTRRMHARICPVPSPP